MTTAQNIIDRVRRLINDEETAFASSLGWTDASLLRWLTDAQRAVVTLKPEANTTTNSFTLEVGKSRQRLLASDALKLIRVEANVGTVENTIDILTDLGPQSQSYGYIQDADVSNAVAALFVDDFGAIGGAFGGSISETSESNGRAVLAMIVRNSTLVLLGLEGSSSDNVPRTVTIATVGGTQTLDIADATDAGAGGDGNYYIYWSNLSAGIGIEFNGPQTVELVT